MQQKTNSWSKRKKLSWACFFFCRNQRKKKKLEKLQTKTSKDHVIEREKLCLEVCFYNLTKKLKKLTSQVFIFTFFFSAYTQKTFALRSVPWPKPSLASGDWGNFSMLCPFLTYIAQPQEKLTAGNWWSFVLSKWNTYDSNVHSNWKKKTKNLFQIVCLNLFKTEKRRPKEII